MSAGGFWGCCVALARLPPSPLLLGCCYIDKRSACSYGGLFYLWGLLTGVGSTDFLSCKIFMEGS